jgi:aldose sugar dehydrogenase
VVVDLLSQILNIQLVVLFTIILVSTYSYTQAVTFPSQPLTLQSPLGPTLNDLHLKAVVVYRGIKFPTTMAFLGPNDILALEKNEGVVQRIMNGTMLPHPLLRVNVANEAERGLLGIAVAKHNATTTYVFLYYTQAGGNNTGSDSEGIQPIGNRLYRYELINNQLVNPKLLLNLPATPGPFHNGGVVKIGPDRNVYVVIGDLFGHRTKAQNYVNGSEPDGTSAILRITQDGKPVGRGILGNKVPLSFYYGYGIRNSFGVDFDPITGKLWDTENGPNYGDEINLVEPGFNSGWVQVQGVWTPKGPIEGSAPANAGPLNLHPSNLVDFGGKGKYRAPEFIWFHCVAPTGITFLNSTKLGKQYQNEMFVGAFHNGEIYHFKLNQNRTGLILNGSLVNKVVNNTNQLKPLVFGSGFGGITDIEEGPDGYLYVLALYEGGNNCNEAYNVGPCISYSSSLQGTIFRIVPSNTTSN